MKVLIVIIIFLKSSLLLSFDINKDGLEVLYNITDISKCRVGGERIRRILGVSLSGCVEECVLRPRCKALCYRRRNQVCDLFQSMQSPIRAGDCIFVSVTDINILTYPCSSCNNGEICQRLSKNCILSECQSQSIENVIVIGNVNTVGSKITYRCEAGYNFTGGEKSSTCKNNGEWDATASCDPLRVDCGPPQNIPNGVAWLDNPTGTFEGDTATVTCNGRYQSKISTITCTEQGVWQTAFCADCYLTTSREYSGLTSKTQTGKTCLRWDHKYNPKSPFTDPGLFPESSLQQANNYCRNPDTAEHEPWCYINDATFWEYCDIKQCS